jgi:hypothetical protein
MSTRKAFKLDDITLKFFMKIWLIIRQEYYKVVLEAIDKGKFPNGVARRLITFLHKGEVRKELFNWRCITLLNVSYKIYAKVL